MKAAKRTTCRALCLWPANGALLHCLQVPPVPTVLPSVPRLVAIGDLHGDMGKARRAFRIAGLIDERDRWVGGTTTVVQVRCLLPSECAVCLNVLYMYSYVWVCCLGAGLRRCRSAAAGQPSTPLLLRAAFLWH